MFLAVNIRLLNISLISNFKNNLTILPNLRIIFL